MSGLRGSMAKPRTSHTHPSPHNRLRGVHRLPGATAVAAPPKHVRRIEDPRANRVRDDSAARAIRPGRLPGAAGVLAPPKAHLVHREQGPQGIEGQRRGEARHDSHVAAGPGTPAVERTPDPAGAACQDGAWMRRIDHEIPDFVDGDESTPTAARSRRHRSYVPLHPSTPPHTGCRRRTPRSPPGRRLRPQQRRPGLAPVHAPVKVEVAQYVDRSLPRGIELQLLEIADRPGLTCQLAPPSVLFHRLSLVVPSLGSQRGKENGPTAQVLDSRRNVLPRKRQQGPAVSLVARLVEAIARRAEQGSSNAGRRSG